jgi:hypothetical protein
MSATLDILPEKGSGRGNNGRNSLLETRPELCHQIGENLKMGMPRKYAAELCKINYATFSLWMNRGEKASKMEVIPDDEVKYFDFFNYINSCEAEAIQIVLKDINSARQEGAWQAGAWLLERRHPEEFGKSNVKVSANVTGNVTIVIGSSDFEESDDLNEPINIGSNKKLLEE